MQMELEVPLVVVQVPVPVSLQAAMEAMVAEENAECGQHKIKKNNSIKNNNQLKL
jgi:hypothetical protein